jgi:hypothetical protein
MRWLVSICVFVAGVLFAAVPASARLLTFDENGNGTWEDPDPVSWNGFMAPDNTGGVAGSVLFYMVPFAPVPGGDVRIWEDASMTVLSDVLRFTDANGNHEITDWADRFIFYSDVGDADLADTGLPVNLQTVFYDGGGVVETGVEGGYRDFLYAAVYHGISDVPEPGSLAVVGVGVASAFVLRRSRESRRPA